MLSADSNKIQFKDCADRYGLYALSTKMTEISFAASTSLYEDYDNSLNDLLPKRCKINTWPDRYYVTAVSNAAEILTTLCDSLNIL